MKRISLLMMVLCTVIVLPAQISITNQHMPKARDTFFYSLGDPTQFNTLINNTGANRTWVVPADSISASLVLYKNSSATPYSGYFANSVGLKIADSIGLGQFKLEDVYQFYSANSTSYRVKGQGFTISMLPFPLAGDYSDEDEMYFFPLTYGRRDSSTFKLKISVFVGSYSQEGHRITEVLGHGRLVLPNDTFDVLQVKSTIISNDTIDVQNTQFGFPTTRIEYRWLAKEYRSPLLEITGTELAGNFVPAEAKYMRVPVKDTSTQDTGNGGNTSISLPAKQQKIHVYPNPATSYLLLDGDYISAEIGDISGKTYLTFTGNVLYMGDLKPGIYFIRLLLPDGNSEVHRILKQ